MWKTKTFGGIRFYKLTTPFENHQAAANQRAIFGPICAYKKAGRGNLGKIVKVERDVEGGSVSRVKDLRAKFELGQ